MGWNLWTKWGDGMGSGGPHLHQASDQDERSNFGMRYPSHQERGRCHEQRSSMEGQYCRRSNDHGQQRGRSDGFAYGEPLIETRRPVGASSRSRTRDRSAGPGAGYYGQPVQHHRGFQVREVSPQQGRSGMFGSMFASRAHLTRSEAERGPHLRSNVPAQGKFPFTVFGKGRENRPDPSTHGHGGGRRNGQRVGNNIMNKYVVKSALKKGGMAEAVNIVQEKRTGKTFVQKSIPLRVPFDYQRARAEINTLLKIDAHGRHDNLNAIIESEISEARKKCLIILEYCEMGCVSDEMTALQRQGGHGRESAAWNILAGVANGLAFLHHGHMNGRPVNDRWDPIFHLDLKPSNIFVASDGGKHGYGRIVLADFGCAITASDVDRHLESPFVPACGTPGWAPPEGTSNGRVLKPYYGAKTDIWQLGATIHVYCKLISNPDQRYLALPRPCSGRYSNHLNRAVKLLCHPQSQHRPSAPGLARDAADGFEAAVRVDRGRR